MEGLPKSDGYEVILAVVDKLKKCVHFSLSNHPYTTSKVASLPPNYHSQ